MSSPQNGEPEELFSVRDTGKPVMGKARRLREDIMAEENIPPPPEGVSGVFYKFAQRKAMELPIVAVGGLIRSDNGVFDLAPRRKPSIASSTGWA